MTDQARLRAVMDALRSHPGGPGTQALVTLEQRLAANRLPVPGIRRGVASATVFLQDLTSGDGLAADSSVAGRAGLSRPGVAWLASGIEWVGTPGVGSALLGLRALAADDRERWATSGMRYLVQALTGHQADTRERDLLIRLAKVTGRLARVVLDETAEPEGTGHAAVVDVIRPAVEHVGVRLHAEPAEVVLPGPRPLLLLLVTTRSTMGSTGADLSTPPCAAGSPDSWGAATPESAEGARWSAQRDDAVWELLAHRQAVLEELTAQIDEMVRGVHA